MKSSPANGGARENFRFRRRAAKSSSSTPAPCHSRRHEEGPRTGRRSPKSKDSDYVFITFVIHHLPHGVVGLLVAVIFCATMSATSAVLNALVPRPLWISIACSGPTIRTIITSSRPGADAGWGLVTIAVASFCTLVENLIEAGNILASVFYGSILGLFLVAFFLRGVRGSAVFFGAVIAQTMVLVLFFTHEHWLSLVTRDGSALSCYQR